MHCSLPIEDEEGKIFEEHEMVMIMQASLITKIARGIRWSCIAITRTCVKQKDKEEWERE